MPWYFDRHQRNTAIAPAYRVGGTTQTAIAGVTGLSVSRICRLIAAQEAKGKNWP